MKKAKRLAFQAYKRWGEKDREIEEQEEEMRIAPRLKGEFQPIIIK